MGARSPFVPQRVPPRRTLNHSKFCHANMGALVATHAGCGGGCGTGRLIR